MDYFVNIRFIDFPSEAFEYILAVTTKFNTSYTQDTCSKILVEITSVIQVLKRKRRRIKQGLFATVLYSIQHLTKTMVLYQMAVDQYYNQK